MPLSWSRGGPPASKGSNDVADQTNTTAQLTVNRRAADRRVKDRRDMEVSPPEGAERRQTPRRKVERRRQIDPTTCEREYSDAEIEFMRAMDEYKRRSGRQFPTWSEVLEVIHCLGYRKVEAPIEILKKD